MDTQMNPETTYEDKQHSQNQDQWVQGVLKKEENGSSFPNISENSPSLNHIKAKLELDTTV